MVTLRKGSSGPDVYKLQRLLGIETDGIFGMNTLTAVQRFQKEQGLIPDGIVGDRTWAALMVSGKVESSSQPNIVHKHLTKNIVRKDRRNFDIKYLVIHYTAGAGSECGRAQREYNTFVNGDASADFAVDDVEMVQLNPDPRKWYCKAVGDGNGKYGITNSNSISIEMCSTLRKGASAKVANHEGWSLTDAVINNTLKLARYLMEEYDIPLENVVRHYDASRKCCPGIIGWNGGTVYTTDGVATKQKNTSEKWVEFKGKL